MKKRLSQIGAVLAFALMALAAWSWWGPGPAKKGVVVTIPQGTTLQGATDYLFYAGAIGGPRRRFYWLARFLGEGDPIQAGEFAVPEGASQADVLWLLQHGTPMQRLVTIPEGTPSIIVQEKLDMLPLATGPTPLPTSRRRQRTVAIRYLAQLRTAFCRNRPEHGHRCQEARRCALSGGPRSDRPSCVGAGDRAARPGEDCAAYQRYASRRPGGCSAIAVERLYWQPPFFATA